MAIGEIHQDDIGTVFQLTIKDQDDAAVDISGATTKQILFQDPLGVTTPQTALFVTDGTDGKLKYTSVSGDLDTAGLWGLQGSVVLTSGTWKSDLSEFWIHGNLE